MGNWNSKHGFALYPTVEWRDNTHLLIKFADNELVPGGLTLTNHFCGNGDQHEIEVVCQNAAYPKTAHIRGTLSALEPCYVDQWTEFSFFNQRHRLNKEPSWLDVRDAVANGKAVWIPREHSYRVINYRPAMPGVTLLEVTTKRACYIDTDRLVPETY